MIRSTSDQSVLRILTSEVSSLRRARPLAHEALHVVGHDSRVAEHRVHVDLLQAVK